MKLGPEHKDKILELFKKKPDLNWITQQVFGGYDENGEEKEGGKFNIDGKPLDGRCVEGRIIREFLAERGKKYKTTKSEAQQKFILEEKHKEFLLSDQISNDMTPLEVARVTFQDETIKPLSKAHRAVIDFLTIYRPDIVDKGANISGSNWHSPKSLVTVIRKVNKWCDVKISENESEIPTKYKRYLDKLLEYLQIYKLERTINAFKIEGDRELFESEFVRATWDKPDLTVDELNLYQMICSNYVRARHIQLRLDSFSAMLENEELQSSELSMKLTETIKVTNEELNACEKRIESLTSKLNGSRAERLKNQQRNAGNILDLVKTVQEQEERKKMANMADMRLKLVKEEAERLESMDEFRARVFGIEHQELL